MQLNEFQKRFKDLMLAHPDALKNPPEDLADFCESGDIDLSARLGVYRNNIVGSLTDVLLASFPLLEKLVGKDFLEGMARSFILENPPSHGCLSHYGDGFAEFIEQFGPAASLPYLPDVARFELALNRAYYAPDDMPLSAETLGEIPPEDLGDVRLKLRESVALLNSPYPLLAIQAFCLAEHPDGTLDLDQGGAALMIYRPQLETQVFALAEDEACMLGQIAREATLGKALQTTLEAFLEFDIQGFLQKHMTLGTFQAF